MDNYITHSVDEIMADTQPSATLKAALASAWIMINFKASSVKILNMEGLSPMADYFVIGNAINPINAEKMASELQFQTKRIGFPTKGVEGNRESDWILLDATDIICHVFLETTRDLYNLDLIWKDAPQVKIPQSYYFSHQEPDEGTGNKTEKGPHDPSQYF